MAAGIPDYDEIRIRIVPDRASGYRVLAFGPDGGTATGGFALPFSDLELDNFILRVGLPRRTVRGFSSSQMEDAKQFGSRLFDAPFQDDVAEAYDSARSLAKIGRASCRERV